MRLGLSLGLAGQRTIDIGPAVEAIVAPVTQDLRVGDTVGDITNIATLRNTANYIADGIVQTPEIRVNGVAQANGFALSDSDAVTLYVADDAGSAPYVRTIDASVVQPNPAFSVQPTITGTLTVGQTLTLTEGVASPATTLEITTFALDGVDKTSELSGLTWDTTGESVYGAGGLIELVVTATNSGDSVVSNTITATLLDVPDAFAVGDWSVTPGAGENFTVTVASLPDDGNSAITDIEYRVDGGSAVSSGGVIGFEVTGILQGSRDIQVRAVNAIGAGAWSDTKTITVVEDTTVAQDRVIGSWHHSLWNNGTTDEVVPYWMDRITDADGGKTIQARGETGQQGRARTYDPPTWTDGWTGVTSPGGTINTWADVDALDIDTLVYLTDNFQGPPANGATETDPTVGGNIPDGNPGGIGADTYVNNTGTSHLSDVFVDYEANLDALVSRTSSTPEFLILENLPEAAIYFATPAAATPTEFANYVAALSGDNATWFANLEAVVKTRVGEVDAGYPAQVSLVPIATCFQSVVNNTPASALTAADWFSDSAPHGNAVTYLFYAMVMHSFLFREAAPEPDFTGSTIPATFTSNYAAIAAHILTVINDAAAADAFVANPIADQAFTQNTGVQTIDVSDVFGGLPTPSVTLLTTTTGVSLSGTTLSIDTGATGLLSGETITLQGSNTGATATDSFALDITVEATAPSVVAALADQSFSENSGVQNIDASGVFDGSPTPSLSLVSPPTGVTISGTTIAVDTGATGLLSGQSITLRATNSEGTADDVFLLDVTAALTAPSVVAALADRSFTEDTGVQTVDASGVFDGNPTPTLSLVSPPTGVTISGTAISVDTATTGLLSGSSITVRAANSEGTADDAFLLDVVAAPSGTIGPLVSFDGTNDYLSGFGNAGGGSFGTTSTFTVAGRFIPNGDMGVLDGILTFFGAGLRHLVNGDLVIQVFDVGFVEIIPETTLDLNLFDNDVIAFMLAIDTSGGMSGGRSAVLYVNGVQQYSGSVTGGNLVLNDDPGGESRLQYLANNGANLLSAETNGLWFSTSEAIDPVAEWTNWFDGLNEFQPIAANGVVNGHTPFFWQNGDAAAWNSGLDNNGVAYTMNGSVT